VLEVFAGFAALGAEGVMVLLSFVAAVSACPLIREPVSLSMKLRFFGVSCLLAIGASCRQCL